MLEEIKKHKIAFGIAFALMVVGLLFFGLDGNGGQNNPKILSIGGKPVYAKDHINDVRKFDLARGLGLYAYGLIGPDVADYEQNIQPSLAAKHKVFEDLVAKLGLQISSEEVQNFITKVSPQFQVEGKFSQKEYNLFVKSLKNRGLDEKTYLEVIKTGLQLNELVAIFSTGYLPNEETLRLNAYANTQDLALSLVSIGLNNVEFDIATDEELKAYWSENRDEFMGKELRSLDFVYVSGDKAPRAPVKPMIVEEEDAGYDEYQEKLADYNTKQVQYEVDLAVYTEANLKLKKRMNEFYTEALAPGTDFVALAKEKGFEPVSLEKVEREGFPDNLRIPRAYAGKVLKSFFALAFEMKWADNEDYRISYVYPVRDGGFYMFKLNEIVAPTPLEFEASKTQVTKKVNNNKKQDAWDRTAQDTYAQINELKESGKTFSEAAESLELKVTEVESFNLRDSASTVPGANLVYRKASTSNVGDVIEPIESGQQKVSYLETR